MTLKVLSGLAMAAMVCLLTQGQKPEAAETWKGWDFMIGDWVADGGGKPGDAASGSYSFTRELDGKILVRKNRAEYPAAGGRPAFKHEDLMIVYKDDQKNRISANYFDNEGHVIQYVVTLAEDGKSVTFVSDSPASMPKFRLTYLAQPDATVRGSFDMAQPGKDFTPYTTWTAHRK